MAYLHPSLPCQLTLRIPVRHRLTGGPGGNGCSCKGNNDAESNLRRAVLIRACVAETQASADISAQAQLHSQTPSSGAAPEQTLYLPPHTVVYLFVFPATGFMCRLNTTTEYAAGKSAKALWGENHVYCHRIVHTTCQRVKGEEA